MSNNVNTIFQTLLVVEIVKFIGLFLWWRRQGLLSPKWARGELKDQLRFILPFGTGTVLYEVNQQIGRLLIASLLGPAALAMFSIGAYHAPVLSVIKSSLSDVVFPEMVERDQTDDKAGLRLWQRTNVVYCFAIFPTFFIFITYAEVLIEILFTAQYLPAVLIFQVLLLVLLREAFDFGTLIRSRNRNIHFVISNAVGLAVNLALSLILMERLGIMAPAVGLVAHSLLNMFYFAAVVLHLYGLSLRELLMWKQVGTLLGMAILCTTILLLAERWIGSPVLAALTGTTVYLGAYVFLCIKAEVAEVTYVVRRLPGGKFLI